MSTEIAQSCALSAMEVICNRMIKLGFEYPMERHLPGTFLKTFLKPLEERLDDDYIMMGQENPKPIFLHQTPTLEELNAFWNTLRLCHAPFIEKKVNGKRVLDVENVKRELYLLSYYICEEDNTFVFMTEKLKEGERERANLIGLQWVLWWTPRVRAIEKCAPNLIRQMLVELVVTDKIQDESASKIYIVGYYMGRPLVMAVPVEAQHCYRDASDEQVQEECGAAYLPSENVDDQEAQHYYRVAINERSRQAPEKTRQRPDAGVPPLIDAYEDFGWLVEATLRVRGGQEGLRDSRYDLVARLSAASRRSNAATLNGEATQRNNVATPSKDAKQLSKETQRSNSATESSDGAILRDTTGGTPGTRTFLRTLSLPLRVYMSIFRDATNYIRNKQRLNRERICINCRVKELREKRKKERKLAAAQSHVPRLQRALSI